MVIPVNVIVLENVLRLIDGKNSDDRVLFDLWKEDLCLETVLY